MNRRLDQLRLATLYQAMGPERILDFPVLDTPFRMYLPYANIDLVQRYILATSNLFEMELLRRVQHLIPPGSAVVDAGANIGNHTLFFGLVGLTQVRCHHAALGAQPGSAGLANYGIGNMAASSFKPGAGSDYPVVALDQLGLDRLDFLKIDVEGSQVAMLEGARETIARHRPMVWIELRATHDEVESGDAAMQALGYRQAEALSPTDFLYAPA